MTPYKDKSYDQDTAELKYQLDQVRNQNENCQAEVKMKEERIQQLLREVQNLVSLPQKNLIQTNKFRSIPGGTLRRSRAQRLTSC